MLPSFATLQDKLVTNGLPTLLADLEQLGRQPEARSAVTLVHEALRTAAHILSADPTQLAGQLLGRLQVDSHPEIAKLLAEAQQWRGAAWLRPLEASLIQPGAPLLRTITGQPRSRYTAIALSVDGQRLLAGTAGGALLFWDITRGQQLAQLSGHTNTIQGVALSDDEQSAVSISEDGTLRVWEIPDGVPRFTLKTHSSWTRSELALSPDGRSVLVGTDEGILTLYDTLDGTVIRTFDGHQDIKDFAQYLKRWRNRSPGNPVSAAPSYTALAFTPDGRRVLSATTAGTLCLWDVEQGTALGVWDGSPPYTTALSILPDNQHALTGAANGSLTLWNVKSPTVRATIQAYSTFIYAVAISGDGRTAVTCAEQEPIKIWSIDGETVLFRNSLAGYDWGAHAVALDGGGERLVSAASDSTLRIWDLTRSAETQRSSEPTLLRLAAMCDRWLCTVDSHSPNRLMLYPERDEQRHVELGRHLSSILALACSADGRWLASGDEAGVVRVWDLSNITTYDSIQTGEPVHGLVMGTDGETVLCWSEGTALSVWDTHRRQLRLKITNCGDYLLTADMSADGQVIAAVIDGYLLSIWQQGGQQRYHDIEYYAAGICEVRMPPDGRVVLAGTETGDLLVWDTVSGSLQLKLTGHNHRITDIAIAPDVNRVVTTSMDGTLRLWDLRQGKDIACFTADSGLLAGTIARNGIVYAILDVTGQLHWLQLEDRPES